MVRQMTIGRGLCRYKNFGRSEDGVSAVEFALVAPVFAIGLLAMIDVGLAIYERMTMDHVLRSGAQAAMSDPGPQHILKVMQSTISASFAADPPDITLDMPARYCACPENANVNPTSAPACTVTCAGSALPYVYYRLGASKTYSGIFMPKFSLSSALQIQIR